MVTVRARKVALGACLLLLVAGCSREQQDWRSAEAADTIEAYDQFIQRHPDSELATQARTRVTQLGEDRDWRNAGSADTAQAYRDFITQHPNGKWAQEARIRIENFALGAQPGNAPPKASAAPATSASLPTSSTPTASASSTTSAAPTASAAPAAQPKAASTTAPKIVVSPAPKVAPTPAAATAAPALANSAHGSSAYGVQLGAFSTEGAAHSQWHALEGRFATVLQGLSERVVAADTASGRVYRLQAAVPDEARARAICGQLKKQNQGCVPLVPH